MSLNSLIKDKLSAKEGVISDKYQKMRNEATKAYEKEREADVREFKAALQKLIDSATARGICITTDRNWSTNKYTANAEVDSQCKELEAIHSRIRKDEKKEKEKFESLNEKAQLSALLPAKERRDEMAAILAEIAKF